MSDYPTEQPDDPNSAAHLVRELVAVIEGLTFADVDPKFPGRFIAIRTDADVSAEVDPLLKRAKAFLIEAEAAAKG